MDFNPEIDFYTNTLEYFQYNEPGVAFISGLIAGVGFQIWFWCMMCIYHLFDFLIEKGFALVKRKFGKEK